MISHEHGGEAATQGARTALSASSRKGEGNPRTKLSALRGAIGCCCIALLIVLGAPGAALAQYAVDWHTMDGGGGTSTGGVYRVSGTISQADAGKRSGGNFTIQGGFWGITAAIRTPGAPLLAIALTATNTVAVFWPSAPTGFVLQQNTNSATSVNWSNVVIIPTDDGTMKTIIEHPSVGNRFYRLVRP